MTILAALPEGWGTEDWGIDPWGASIPVAPLALENARAISTREVEVTLTRAPQAIAPTIPGDALNPATWTIQRLDTGGFFSVVEVTQTGPTTLVVRVLQDLASFKVTHRISSSTLLDFDGNPISIPPSNRFDFLGLLDNELKDQLTRASRNSSATRDIANPPIPGSAEFSSPGGTLVISAAGDYELESGIQLVKKLILRRLTTPTGSFSHLPGYGVGLGTKELIRATDLQALRIAITNQVLQEPEVEEASITLVLGRSNDLTVKIRVTVAPSGETLQFGFQVKDSQIIL